MYLRYLENVNNGTCSHSHPSEYPLVSLYSSHCALCSGVYSHFVLVAWLRNHVLGCSVVSMGTGEFSAYNTRVVPSGVGGMQGAAERRVNIRRLEG